VSTRLSPTEQSLLLKEADAATARLRWRLRLTPEAAEDVRQDLLLDLVRRMATYDPARGPIGPFAGRILRNRGSELAAAIVADRRALFSVAEPQSVHDVHVQQVSDPGDEGRDRRLSLFMALRRLSSRDRAFCLALARFSMDRLAAAGFGSRAGLYRRVQDLRCRVAAFGLAA
jgi:DNA-directed RNA polymerase specialized sigma24 family protein